MQDDAGEMIADWRRD